MNRVVLRDASRGCWLDFAAPREVITAFAPGAVRDALRAVDARVTRDGLHAAGFLAYEAAPAFDRAFAVPRDGGFPLLWFGIYDAPRVLDLPAASGPVPAVNWEPVVSRQEYGAAFETIRAHIAEGDTYQVNYSFRLRARFASDPWDFFLRCMAPLRPQYGAFVAAEEWSICSASPELFFRLEGDRVESRPMKGTLPCGRFRAEDAARSEELRESEKNRAENLMIVDMVRNDLGRVAATGSVHVPRLFEVERHPTVLQMTSTVAARTAATAAELLRALFPAASITGAPKARSTQIIAEVESSPRRIYTGTIGFMTPERGAQFNVAIRTALFDRARGVAEYGIGSGLVWDSRVDDEYEECRVKARLLGSQPREFDLLETMLWLPGQGVPLLDRHLARLAESAAYFGWHLDQEHIRESLQCFTRNLAGSPHRLRLRATERGEVFHEAGAFDPSGPHPRRVGVASQPVDSADVFLFHKTTERGTYESARASAPGCDDVILYNEKGEVTESTMANVVVDVDGDLFTPPLACGLLAGVQRGRLLEEGRVRERVITLDDLRAGSGVYLVNALRGMWRVELAAGDYSSRRGSTMRNAASRSSSLCQNSSFTRTMKS